MVSSYKSVSIAALPSFTQWELIRHALQGSECILKRSRPISRILNARRAHTATPGPFIWNQFVRGSLGLTLHGQAFLLPEIWYKPSMISYLIE